MRSGTIYRTVESLGIGYLEEDSSGLTYPFRFTQVSQFNGQPIEEFGLVPGVPARFEAKGEEAILVELSGHEHAKAASAT